MRNKLHLTIIISSFLIFLFLVNCCTNKRMDCSFGNAMLETSNNDKDKSVSFIVIYNGDLSDMITDNNSNFKTLIDTYGFRIEQPFEINTKMKGIVLLYIFQNQ